MDCVAQCLLAVQKQLDENNIKYRVVRTRPTRNLSSLDEDSLCVLRQQVDADGVYHLVVGAKASSKK